MATCREFIEARITAVEAMIIAYEAAITALGTSNIQSYKLDTGQSVQTVTKADLTSLKNTLESQYNLYMVLNARIGQCGAPIIARPVW